MRTSTTKKFHFKSTAKCFFCKQHTEPEYKNYESLRQFMSFRGTILSSDKTGICATHQRKLSREIRRARELALLPFVVYEE